MDGLLQNVCGPSNKSVGIFGGQKPNTLFFFSLLIGTLLTIKPIFYYFYQPCVLSTLVCKTFTHISLKFVIQFFFIINNQRNKFELLITINVC